MRILLVTWNYPPKVGGMEMMLYQLVQHLTPYADVHVIGPYAGSSGEGADNVIRSKRDGLIRFVLHGLFSGVRLLRETSYDVILAGSALVVPTAYILGLLFKLPVVANVYGLDLIYPHPAYQWMVRIFLPRCHHVVAISRASMESAVERGVSRDRVFIIHPGVEFSEFAVAPELDAVRQAYGLDGRLVLLSVGRLARRKGTLEFVRYSLPSIVRKHPSVIFFIVGGNPVLSLTHKEDLRTLIQAEVSKLGLDENVQLLGWVDRQELIHLYHASDIFVLPAIAVKGDVEGFGIVLIEASAAGKPVVSTRLGGIPDAVEDGKSGVLVEAGAWDELASVIADLLSDEELRQNMGYFGRERAKTQFDWSVIAQQYAELLASLGEEVESEEIL